VHVLFFAFRLKKKKKEKKEKKKNEWQLYHNDQRRYSKNSHWSVGPGGGMREL
jgi:hypothetical protein